MTPCVTVVIPTRNRREMLMTTLRSVLGQRDTSFEVVVVDDGSTDDTREAVERLGGGPLRVIPSVTPPATPRPLGVSAARNAGLNVARTEWVAFCDDDDLWAPHKLALQLAALRARRDAEWCLAGSIVFDRPGRFVQHGECTADGTLYRRLLASNVVPGGGSGVMVRASAARQVGGFDPTLHFAEDWEMWLRLARAFPAAAVNRPLVAYRYWPSSASFLVQAGPALDELARRYAQELRRHDVRLDLDVVQRRSAIDAAFRGQRLVSARRFLRLARMERSPKTVVAAAMAFAAPHSVYELLTKRTADLVPAEWSAEAAEWLWPMLAAPHDLVGVP